MYTLKKNGKVINKFKTYDQARNEARRLIRKVNAKQRSKIMEKNYILWDEISRNPSTIKPFGFKIVRV